MMRSIISAILLLQTLEATSLKKLTQECQKRSAVSCYELGYKYDQKNKLSQAATLYQKACSLKHAKGCYKLAELYLVGSGVEQNDDTFIKYAKRSCDLGYQKSCTFIKETKPVKEYIQPLSSNSKKQINSITFQEKGIGSITVSAKLIDEQKRIVQIDASMRNDLMRASGWLSFSFPEIRTDQVIAMNAGGFTHIKSYPQGNSIYHIKQKKAIPSRYLLVEADIQKWRPHTVKKCTFKLEVPNDMQTLTLYIRGTLKHKDILRSIPLKGSIGQQGFHNAMLKLTIGTAKKKYAGMQLQMTPTANNRSTVLRSPVKVTLNRRDKLLLLDQLLNLSYYHRERKAFEKQLKETLFGGAKYFTHIKSYRCEAKRGTNKSICLLRLGGKITQNHRDISWEFQAEFTARKDRDGLKITEMHSLDLLE